MTVDLDALERLERKATPKPWSVENTTTANSNYACGSGPWILCDADDPRVLADAVLIAAARNALADLLAELRRLRELETDVIAYRLAVADERHDDAIMMREALLDYADRACRAARSKP